MSDFILDTNTLYTLLGTEPETKITKLNLEALAKIHKIYIPSVVVYEVIIHYRNDISKIKIIADYFLNNRNRVFINIRHLLIDIKVTKVIEKSIKSNNLSELQNDIDILLDAKITCEIDFINFFIFVSFIGIIKVLIEDEEYNYSEEILKKIEHNSIEFLAMITKELKNRFKFDLRKAYIDGTTEEWSKSIFIETFYTQLRAWFSIYFCTVYNIDIKKKLSEDEKRTYDLFVSSNSVILKIENLIKKGWNPLSVFANKKDRKQIYKYIEFVEAAMSSRMGIDITKTPKEFMSFMFEKIYIAGKKFEKNDTMDLLILYSLDHKELKHPCLITEDGNLVQFIKETRSGNYNFLNSMGVYSRK